MKLLEELRTEDALAGVGFSDADIDGLLDSLEKDLPPTDLEDPGPGEPPLNPVTQPGDLWLLGEHRLLCGDAGNATDVDRLLAGAQIHLVNTDPPYNVRVEPRSNNAIAAGLSSFGEPGLKNHQGFDKIERATRCSDLGRANIIFSRRIRFKLHGIPTKESVMSATPKSHRNQNDSPSVLLLLVWFFFAFFFIILGLLA